MSNEEAVHIRVTGKQLGFAIMALVAAIGGYPLANQFNPNLRSDPFTGSDGKEQSRRSDEIEDRIEILELEVAQCQQRNSNHRESQAGILAELKSGVKTNRFLIERCMIITGN